MRDTTVTTTDPETAVHEWFEMFGPLVAAEEYDAARDLFADEVVSFGTKAELVESLGHLVEQQWAGIWPVIEDFAFTNVQASGVGDCAWGVATWTSTGFDAEGNSYDRPGRATITFERRDGQWLAVHTHFSLYPGTPGRTYGPNGQTDEQ